jgi:hemoglobin
MIGTEGFTRLVAAFYRQIPQDDLLKTMYPPRFGGPASYIEQRGHPRLRLRHATFPIGKVARDRWMRLMRNALAEAALPPAAEQVLRKFLEATSISLINQVQAGNH